MTALSSPLVSALAPPPDAAPPAVAPATLAMAVGLAALGRLDEARQAFEQVIAETPGLVEAHTNLGVVVQMQGDLQRAIGCYRMALSIASVTAPDTAAIHSNLAAALSDTGSHFEALEHARQAVALSPEFAAAYAHVGSIEMRLCHYTEALTALDQALALLPDNVDILLLKANALRFLERPAEGLAVCRKAVALAPEQGMLWNELGLTLAALNQDDEALAALSWAEKLLPQPALVLANRIGIMMQLGREGVESTFRRAIAADPWCVPAWYNWALANRFGKDDPDIGRMEEVLNALPPHNADRLLMHYALGKGYMEGGDDARAFEHYAHGSRMKRAGITYDARATLDQLRDTIAAFPALASTAPREGADASPVPVFVLGMPRSGTSLVEQILASHPTVFGAGEVPFLEQAVKALEAEAGNPYPALVAATDRLNEIGRAYLGRLTALAPQAQRIIDKRTTNFLYAGLIHRVLPGAKIIHCRRDPVDTCLSAYTKLFAIGYEFSYDLTELGEYWRAYRALTDHWRAVLPPDVYLEVDYEAVVGDIDAEARRLIEFCGLPWDDACLRFYETRRPVRTASFNQVRQPVYASSVGRGQAVRPYVQPLLDALFPESALPTET